MGASSGRWAMYKPPDGDGPAFCANNVDEPPPWPGRWTRVAGGWMRSAEEPSPPPVADPKPNVPPRKPSAAEKINKWRAEHPFWWRSKAHEKRRKRWREANPEKVSEIDRKRGRRWRAANPDKVRANWRRARLRMTPAQRKRRAERALRRWRDGGYEKQMARKRAAGKAWSESLVRLTWARIPGEDVFHLVPTNRKLSAKPPMPNHPICAPSRRVVRLVCPCPPASVPVVQCRDCIAASVAWWKAQPHHPDNPTVGRGRELVEKSRRIPLTGRGDSV